MTGNTALLSAEYEKSQMICAKVLCKMNLFISKNK